MFIISNVVNMHISRSQNVERILLEELFPILDIEERTRHWVHLFSLFEPLHMKALNSILSQKQRYWYKVIAMIWPKCDHFSLAVMFSGYELKCDFICLYGRKRRYSLTFYF